MDDETIQIEKIRDAHLAAISTLRNEIETLFEHYSDRDTLTTQTLKQLFWYMSQRSQAVSFLVSTEYTWDAEIVLRAFYEAAAKIVFICRAKQDEKNVLVEEFWDGLGSIGDKRHAHKAKFAQAIYKNAPDSARVFEYLSRPEASRNPNYRDNKLTRKKIEQKWSFSGIVEALDRELPGAKSLLHIYGIASHLIHSDTGALELMMDRQLREPEELLLLHASHMCRIFSDQLALWYFCAMSLKSHLDGKFLDAAGLRKQFDECSRLNKPVMDFFNKSQNEFYEQKTGTL